ncbi:hypothetical protein [Sphingomonas sp.]|uniref:hypothetical protein n=1 Tax=Sphingomonas sp. TaxID=28214 RepID=UPI003D6C962F
MRPEFSIVSADRDPLPDLSAAFADPRERGTGTPDPEAYRLPTWRAATGAGRTDDVHSAGVVRKLLADKATWRDGAVVWTFPSDSRFTLGATVTAALGGGEPVIRFTFSAKRDGWYSIGYTGMPATDPQALEALYQPLIWQEKRFPRAPLTTSEAMGGLPLTLVSKGGITTGLAVDPGESPFRMPTVANARFGVMLRNPAGLAQPTVFAPLLGVGESRMKAGSRYAFAMRPVMVRGDWYAAYTQVAHLFGFGDYRENGDLPLNATLDNMIDFAMDDAASYWDRDLKGFSYITDVPGTVKVVSALHPMSLALIRDDPEIYRRRALPVSEYLMSREKYLYSQTVSEDGQGASHAMAGPSAEVGELVGLYQFSRGTSTVFRDYAVTLAGKPRALNLDMISDPDTFQNHLALYRLTGKPGELARARTLADAYVAKRIDRAQTDFSDARLATGGQFWSDFAPKWIDLFELWQETGEQRYLDAATAGARSYASFAWYFPKIPPGDITVDKGGHAPFGWPFGVRKTAMGSPERTLPAWRVAQTGLTPEASTTWEQNPAIFLTNHAPFFLRIAKASGDPFLHEAARAAVVGRYANYPGYDINEAFSDIYARADYPHRAYEEYSYNQVYYNHVWPQIALLTDYLVSDTETRSNGAIRFPSRYAPGYAYLQSNVYGDRPGRFMGDDGVMLWMPKRVVAIDDVQVDFLSARGNGNFYLALNNASHRPVNAMVTLDPDYVNWVPGKRYAVSVWVDGAKQADTVAVDGKVGITLTPGGQTALTIHDMPTFTRMQTAYFSAKTPALGAKSHVVSATPFGDMTGMLLAFPGQPTAAYVWLTASDAKVKEARLTIEGGDKPVVMTDARHPFEFEAPFAADARSLRYSVEAVMTDGRVERSGSVTLER